MIIDQAKVDVNHLLQIIDLGDRRLQIRQQIEVNFNFPTMVVDLLLVLHESTQVLNVCL